MQTGPRSSRTARFLLTAALGAAISWSATPAAAQEPQEEDGEPALDVAARLDDARDAFVLGDYDGIVQRLKPVAERPQALQTLSPGAQAELYRFLGMGLLLKSPSEREAAAAAFLELLKRQPDFTFIESVSPPQAVELLQEVRAAHPDLFRPVEEPQPGPSSIVYIQREVVEHPAWLNLLPPLGQFQNGQEVRGWLFLVGEALALATNVTSFIVVEQLRGSSGLYTPRDARIADTAQNIQIASFYIFLGVVALGITDAFYAWEPEAVQLRRLEAPPPELSRRHHDPTPRVAVDLWSSPSPDATPEVAAPADTDLSGALLRLAWPF